jgi:hypothetical protein
MIDYQHRQHAETRYRDRDHDGPGQRSLRMIFPARTISLHWTGLICFLLVNKPLMAAKVPVSESGRDRPFSLPKSVSFAWQRCAAQALGSPLAVHHTLKSLA